VHHTVRFIRIEPKFELPEGGTAYVMTYWSLDHWSTGVLKRGRCRGVPSRAGCGAERESPQSTLDFGAKSRQTKSDIGASGFARFGEVACLTWPKSGSRSLSPLGEFDEVGGQMAESVMSASGARAMRVRVLSRQSGQRCEIGTVSPKENFPRGSEKTRVWVTISRIFKGNSE
jgi:hypothetical protein